MVKIALFLRAIVVAAYAIALYNALVDAKHRVEQGWSGIDVLLRQRHDAMPRLIEVIRKHDGADGALLEQASALCGRTGSGAPDGDRLASEEALSRCIRSLLEVGAGHPQFQAVAACQDLQQRIGALEEQIAQRRDCYNTAAKLHNGRMGRFPTCSSRGWPAWRAARCSRPGNTTGRR